MSFEPQQTRALPAAMDYLAPDGSEIRLLSSVEGDGACHCALPVGAVSQAVSHLTVEEIWFFLNGEDKVWRRLGSEEQVTDVKAGISLTIPCGTRFQFKNTGSEPLTFIIVTMPPWPGPQEAEKSKGIWQAAVG